MVMVIEQCIKVQNACWRSVVVNDRHTLAFVKCTPLEGMRSLDKSEISDEEHARCVGKGHQIWGILFHFVGLSISPI